MAQINVTLDQAEVLRLLEADCGDAFRTLLQEALNCVLRAESAEQLHAGPYERTERRTDSRNGVRARPLTTRIGSIELAVPRHRNVPFRTLVFDNYKRSEAALVTVMAEMVVAGVSTAKVGRVMEDICGRSFSKQAVSEACGELDAAVEAFRTRPIDRGYLFVMADATYLKVREGHRIVSKALMIAIGLTPSGRKEVIGFELADGESEGSWEASPGVTSPGPVAALHRTFPDVPWQRCQAHFARNVADAAPKHLRAGLRSELVEMFNSPTIAGARARRDEIIADYREVAPRAAEALDAGFDDAMTVMELPEGMRRPTRTTNYLERLNAEVKRRSKVIGVFPNAASATRLMGSFLIEEDARWAQRRTLYYRPAVMELEKSAAGLAAIARRQRELMLAA